MTKPNSSLIAIVLDRSGSMSSIRSDTVGGVNAFLADQKKTPGECRVTLAQFDHDYEVVHNSRPISEIPLLTEETYVPRGNTALLDAIGRTIATTGEALAAMPEAERPSQVVVCCVTDGHENASHEYSASTIREMVKRQTETYNWNFVFLGANLDAIDVASTYGILRGNAMSYTADAAGMGQMFASVSSNIASYRSTNNPHALSFTDLQRQENDPNAVITPDVVSGDAVKVTTTNGSTP